MGLPAFLLRRLYRRGSLREVGDGWFAFDLHNPLGDATLTGPPVVVVNGIRYAPQEVQAHAAGAPALDLGALSPGRPHRFARGDVLHVRLPGRLLRGGNRIHITAPTKEFGEVEVFVEDREADFCEVPGLGDGEE